MKKFVILFLMIAFSKAYGASRVAGGDHEPLIPTTNPWTTGSAGGGIEDGATAPERPATPAAPAARRYVPPTGATYVDPRAAKALDAARREAAGLVRAGETLAESAAEEDARLQKAAREAADKYASAMTEKANGHMADWVLIEDLLKKAVDGGHPEAAVELATHKIDVANSNRTGSSLMGCAIPLWYVRSYASLCCPTVFPWVKNYREALGLYEKALTVLRDDNGKLSARGLEVNRAKDKAQSEYGWFVCRARASGAVVYAADLLILGLLGWHYW